MSASQIYHDAIKALATTATGEGTLESADGKALVDNPLCGDRVEMQVKLAAGRIVAVGHRVRGCLLCRAAAASIGTHAPGATPAEIEQASSAVSDMLERQGPVPAAWSDLEAFVPVHGHKSRYRCVQLPFEALIAALRAAGN